MPGFGKGPIRTLPFAHTLCCDEHAKTYMSVRLLSCFWGMMICTDAASPQLGTGCDKMHSARTTCPTRLVFPGKYEGSPITNWHNKTRKGQTVVTCMRDWKGYTVLHSMRKQSW